MIYADRARGFDPFTCQPLPIPIPISIRLLLPEIQLWTIPWQLLSRTDFHLAAQGSSNPFTCCWTQRLHIYPRLDSPKR